MKDDNCLFCKIVAGEEKGEKVWENEAFLAIKNKYPKAPVHILVMPKEHIEKKEMANFVAGKSERLWGKIMEAVFEVVLQYDLDKTGYKLANNGAGYNHFEHEHIHVLGGGRDEPAGKL
jgi:histidine triad (HIT) family protein